MSSFAKDSARERIAARDWPAINKELHDKGFVMITGMLTREECQELSASYDTDYIYRKTIDMARYRFGSGEYKYFRYPLPAIIETLREEFYARIVPTANQWMEELGLDTRFPLTHPAMKKICHDHGQTQPTALILRYEAGGFNTLHQDLYGDIYFPIQIVCMLDQPEKDYTGGEFVITEQIPRAQSRANVLKPHRGDILIFTTRFRPVKSSKGYYKVHMKHGVSPLHNGRRHSLGIIFHDGAS